jgi:hypothetical protein
MPINSTKIAPPTDEPNKYRWDETTESWEIMTESSLPPDLPDDLEEMVNRAQTAANKATDAATRATEAADNATTEAAGTERQDRYGRGWTAGYGISEALRALHG